MTLAWVLSIDYRRSRLHVNNQSTRIISTEKVGCTGSPTLYIFHWLYPLIYQLFMQSSHLYRCMPLAYLPFIFPSSMVFIVDQVDQNITGANIFFFFLRSFYAAGILTTHLGVRGFWKKKTTCSYLHRSGPHMRLRKAKAVIHKHYYLRRSTCREFFFKYLQTSANPSKTVAVCKWISRHRRKRQPSHVYNTWY